MISLRFNYYDIKVDSVVEKVKIFLTRKVDQYWCINRCINNVINKFGCSEYQEETGANISIHVDNELVSNSDRFFWIKEDYDFNNEMKLGSNSLLLKYLQETILNQVFTDDFLRLNSYLKTVSYNLSTEDLIFNSIEINQKTLPKFLKASITRDDCLINENDFSYEDNLLFQLELLRMITNKRDYRNFVFLDIPYLTKKIQEYFNCLPNCYIFVITQHLNHFTTEMNLHLDGYDLENDNELYERMITMTNFYDLKEYKQRIIDEHLNHYL